MLELMKKNHDERRALELAAKAIKGKAFALIDEEALIPVYNIKYCMIKNQFIRIDQFNDTSHYISDGTRPCELCAECILVLPRRLCPTELKHGTADTKRNLILCDWFPKADDVRPGDKIVYTFNAKDWIKYDID